MEIIWEILNLCKERKVPHNCSGWLAGVTPPFFLIFPPPYFCVRATAATGGECAKKKKTQLSVVFFLAISDVPNGEERNSPGALEYVGPGEEERKSIPPTPHPLSFIFSHLTPLPKKAHDVRLSL